MPSMQDKGKKRSFGETATQGGSKDQKQNASASAESQGGTAKLSRRERSHSYEEFIGTYNAWKAEEDAAEALIPIIGRMYKDKNIVVKIYHRRLNKQSHIEVLKVHQFVKESLKKEVSVKDSLAICVAFNHLATSALYNSQLDIGLVFDALQNSSPGMFDATGHLLRNDAESIKLALLPLVQKLIKHDGPGDKISSMEEARDVVLFGFGRIGRLLTRLLVEKAGSGKKLMLRAVVVRRPKKEEGHLEKRMASLLMDTVHGPFNGIIVMDKENNALIANGIFIKFIYSEPNPADIDYSAHGIRDAILIDNTGIFRNRKGLGTHLQAKGISRVILTAPGEGDIPNIVSGVNCNGISMDSSEHILSAASCTTNAIVPVLKAIDDSFGIQSGHLETVHSFTNDQNLVDNFHKKNRRGRSAPCNLVLTETGAGKAAGRALPALAGKLTASAIRVPTPNVSMAVLILNLKKQTTAEQVNEVLRKLSMTEKSAQIGYSTSQEVCSSDFVGHRSAGIVDAPRTRHLGKRVNLYVWYDNEFGYSCQVIRLLQKLAGIQHTTFPPPMVSTK